jgi:hypothetical protein
LDLEHPFRPHTFGSCENVFLLGMNDDLRITVAVAEIEEDETTMIAPPVDPSTERHFPPYIRRAEFAAGVRAEHGGIVSARFGLA